MSDAKKETSADGGLTVATIITKLQNVQRRNPPTSALWKAASRELAGMYAKVATFAPELQHAIAERVPGMILHSPKE
jgi:hypothetical protein